MTGKGMTWQKGWKVVRNAARRTVLGLVLACGLSLGVAPVTAPSAHAFSCAFVPNPMTPASNAAQHASTRAQINARLTQFDVTIAAQLDAINANFMTWYLQMVELLNRFVSNQQSQSAQNRSAIQMHSQQLRAGVTGLNEEQVRREKKDIMQEATIAATPSATGCQVASASVSLNEAEQGTREQLATFRRGGGPSGARGSLGRSQGGGRASGAAASPDFTPEQLLEGVAPDADMATTYAEFLEFFCNKRFERRGACQVRTVDGEEMADRDVDPQDSLFGKLTLESEPLVPGDPDRRSYDQLAAENVIRNLIQPIQPEAFPVEAVQNDVENRRLYVRQRANMARVGMANLPLEAIAAQRDAAVSGDWAKQMLAKFDIPEDDVPDEVSEFHLFEILMSQRFKDPDYWLRITGSEGSVALEEVAQLLALNMLVEWETMRLMQMRAGIASTRLGMAVEGQQLRPNLEGIRTELPAHIMAGGHGADALGFGIEQLNRMMAGLMQAEAQRTIKTGEAAQ